MTKIISVSDHTYALLSRLKGKKSFSKMLEELAEKDIGKGDVSRLEPLFGALKGFDVEKRLREIKQHRERFGKKRLAQ